MIYRVVERSDGLYQAQYRVGLFWWCDSCGAPSPDRRAVEAFAERFSSRKPKVKRVVWTPSRGSI